MAYLRIFGPDNVAREVPLDRGQMALGRNRDADVRLDHENVSRRHAVILGLGAGHQLSDRDSRAGTIVNGKAVGETFLKHGDVVQMGPFVLEYRTDEPAERVDLPGSATSVLGRLHQTLRRKYLPLPAGVSWRYRTVNCDPATVFASGDTVRVGHGGLLLPCLVQPPPEGCLEIELCRPGGRARLILAEVMATLPVPKEAPDPEEGLEAETLCLKLHNVEKNLYEATLSKSLRSRWLSPAEDSRGDTVTP